MGEAMVVFLCGVVAITSVVGFVFAGLGICLLFNFKGIRR